ncbi:MAG: cellulase family glycosylhydrolase [Gaiellaceae bacterium]|jgi:hypothetical protein
MRRILRASCVLILVCATVSSASGAGKAKLVKTSSGSLSTGFVFVPMSSSADNQIEFEHMRSAGANLVRINVYWSTVAPPTEPAGFKPRDPADPNYQWQSIDDAVKAATDSGLEPILLFVSAPTWAEGANASSFDAGTDEPSPSALGDFATAAAQRYKGDFVMSGEKLPRVRYWGVWNEPNLNPYLSPQHKNGKPFAPQHYRLMVNHVADAVHAVHSDNVVIAGDTAPFGVARANHDATTPLVFMEDVLCIAEKKVVDKRTKKISIVYRSACKKKTKFDIWSHHPYTEGGPTRRAKVHGDASLGDMGDIRMVLNAAIEANHVVSSRNVKLWVTEFSWDSNPPDPKGVPISLEARWVSEMLYRMWANGVSLVLWWQIRDEPFPSSYYQSGLYYLGADGIASDRPKPALRAFRFPFVALRIPKNKVRIWGRTPNRAPGTVLVERASGAQWKKVGTLRAIGYGIFQSLIPKPRNTVYLRARLSGGNDASVPFSLNAPTKTWIGCVWGSCTLSSG